VSSHALVEHLPIVLLHSIGGALEAILLNSQAKDCFLEALFQRQTVVQLAGDSSCKGFSIPIVEAMSQDCHS